MDWKNLDGTENETAGISMDKETIVQVWRGSSLSQAESSIRKVSQK